MSPPIRALRAVAILAAALGACGFASCASPAAELPLELSGPYEASGGGSISSITFTDATHYFLWTAPCTGPSSACFHQGAYSVNAARDQLSLTDAATGATTTMPFKARETSPMMAPLATLGFDSPTTTASSSQKAALHPLGASLTGGDAALTSGTGTALVTGPTVALVTSFSSSLVQFNAKQFAMHAGAERLAQHAAGASCDVKCLEQGSLDWLNAYWLARLAQLAYLDPSDLTPALAAVGLKTDAAHFQTFDDPSTDTHAFYVTTAGSTAAPALTSPSTTASPDVAVLAFRGTDLSSILNLETDLEVWQNGSGSTLGSVHAGFFNALSGIWSLSIDAFLASRHHNSGGANPTQAGAELYVTGHSLGAGLATVALGKTLTDSCAGTLPPKCTAAHIPVSALYTFGSPRVGNLKFSNDLASSVSRVTPIFRFVHDIPSLGSDLVPTTPPTPLYLHLSTTSDESQLEVFVEDGASTALIGTAPPTSVKTVPLTSISNIQEVHAIANYVATTQAVGGLGTSLLR